MEAYDMNRFAVTNSEFKHTITTVIHSKGQIIDLNEPYYSDGAIDVVFLEDDGTPAPTATLSQTDCLGMDDESVDAEAYAQLWRIYLDNGGVHNGSVTINGKTVDAYVTFNPFLRRLKVTNVQSDFHGNLDNNGNRLSLPRRVQISYYAFQRNDYDTIDGNVGPQYTPALMLAVLKKLDELSSALSGRSATGMTVSDYKCKPLDLTGYLRENYIGGGLLSSEETAYPAAEERIVNVPAGDYIIHPHYGPFYGHDFAIVFNGNTLVEGEDYELQGMDPGRTQISQPNSGVYNFIRLRKAIVATEANPLRIRYHAFGNEVTPEVFDRFSSYVLAFIASITSGDILTSSNIGQNAAFKSLVERVANAEKLVGLYPTTNLLIKPSTTGIRGYANRWVNVAYYTAPVWSNAVVDFVSHVSSTFRLTFNIGNDRLFSARFCLNINFKDMTVDVVPLMVNEYAFEESVSIYREQTVIPKFRILKGFKGTSSSELGGYILQMCLTPLDISNINTVSFVANLFNETCQADHVWTMAPNADSEDAHAVIYGDTDMVTYNGSDFGKFAGHRSNVVAVTMTPFVVARKDYFTATGQDSVLPKAMKDIDPYTFEEGQDADGYSNGELTEGDGLRVDGAAPTVAIGDCLGHCLTGIGVQIFDRVKQVVTYHILNDLTRIVESGKDYDGFYGKEFYNLDDLCMIGVKKEASSDFLTPPVLRLRSCTGSKSKALSRYVLLRIDYLLNGSKGILTEGYTEAGLTDPVTQSELEAASTIPETLYRANCVSEIAKL